MKRVKIKKIRTQDGYDCWGRPEYDYSYAVEDENGEVIYASQSDPTDLINYIYNQ